MSTTEITGTTADATTPVDHRAALIAGLRDFADHLEQHPTLPVQGRIDYCSLATDDAAGRAEIIAIGAMLDATPIDTGDSVEVSRQFAGLTYRAFYCFRAGMDEYYALQSYRGAVAPETDGPQ